MRWLAAEVIWLAARIGGRALASQLFLALKKWSVITRPTVPSRVKRQSPLDGKIAGAGS
jgi:hypothetical protein